MKILQHGAEAIISLDENNHIIKNRIKKSYRLSVLDEKLRSSRTRAEVKIINKLSKLINVPKIIKTDNNKIIMDYIEGKKLSDFLEKLNWKKICKQLGEVITKLHNNNIIHGDLTTSNMIYVEDLKKASTTYTSKNLEINNINNKNKITAEHGKKNNFKIYLIDFGLGFHSHKIEDKAVDLHLLKQALEAKHFKIASEAIKIILDNYKADNYNLIIEQLKKVESRGRYKDKY